MIFLSLTKSQNISKSINFTLNTLRSRQINSQPNLKFTNKFHQSKNPSKWSISRSSNTTNKQTKSWSTKLRSIRWHGITGGHMAIDSNSKPLRELTNMQILKKLLSFVWPKDNNSIKLRVVFAMGLLIGSKLLTISVPFIFKEMVEFLSNNASLKDFNGSTESVLAVTVIALALGYGAARSGASMFGELRNAIFARVAQASVSSLATQLFRHLHKLDLNFHLNRQTGALSKAIDRGNTLADDIAINKTG